MFGNLKSGLKQRIKGVVDDIKSRRVDAAEPYVPPVSARPTPIARPAVDPAAEARAAEVRAAEAARAEAAKVEAAKAAEAARVAEAAKAEAAKAAEAARVAEAAKAEAAKAEAARVVEAAKVAEAANAVEAPAPAVETPVTEAPAVAPVEQAAKEPPAATETPAVPKATSVAALAAAAAAGKVQHKAMHADMGSTDLDAYVLRAKANGRALDTLKGGTGLNHADDGEAYWGPVDNESSRAKAAGKVLTIDQFECISCGTCVEQTDKVYYLPDDGKAIPIAQDGPMDLIQDAIDACPVTCIAWMAPEEAEERGVATGIEGSES